MMQVTLMCKKTVTFCCCFVFHLWFLFMSLFQYDSLKVKANKELVEREGDPPQKKGSGPQAYAETALKLRVMDPSRNNMPLDFNKNKGKPPVVFTNVESEEGGLHVMMH